MILRHCPIWSRIRLDHHPLFGKGSCVGTRKSSPIPNEPTKYRRYPSTVPRVDPGFFSYVISSRWRKRSQVGMSAYFFASFRSDCYQMLWYLKLNCAHFATKKLNDNQAGALKRCPGAFFMPERCGGSQTFMPRMVSNRVSMHFIFYAEREL